MIVTTTPNVEGKQIVEYKQVVFGEVIAGANFMRDFFAGVLYNTIDDVSAQPQAAPWQETAFGRGDLALVARAHRSAERLRLGGGAACQAVHFAADGGHHVTPVGWVAVAHRGARRRQG